jgi:hypothetical protein
MKDTLREWEVDDVVKVTGNCRGEPSGPTARANYQTTSNHVQSCLLGYTAV